MAGEVFGRSADPVSIDVWSDVMCPFCYMGDALLGQALERFPHETVTRYHAFQLMPELPSDKPQNVLDILEREKGFPRAQAEAMNAQVAERGKSLGLDYRFDTALAVNTRDAHRLSHFAAAHGSQTALVHRLFKAFFTDGLNVADHDVLADLAAESGLDRAAALSALKNGDYDDAVDADIRQARELRVTGVPFFVIDGKYGVSGAQPVEAFLQALDTAWSDR